MAKPTESNSQQLQHIILQKPLPAILDSIEASIGEAERAAADARQAAEEARVAGEKAADAVMRRIKKLFLSMADDITHELRETNNKTIARS